MSNREKAAEVIDQWAQEGYELNSAVGSAHAIAERLADAGLIAPDLPEPNNAGFWRTDNTMTSVQPGPLVEVVFYGRGLDTYAKLTPAEARELAANLTAAANYSQEGNRD